MISQGGSYIKKNGKLELVERTEEPKADTASGGASSLPLTGADGAPASAESGGKPNSVKKDV